MGQQKVPSTSDDPQRISQCIIRDTTTTVPYGKHQLFRDPTGFLSLRQLGHSRVALSHQDNFRFKLSQVQTTISPVPFIGFRFLPEVSAGNGVSAGP